MQDIDASILARSQRKYWYLRYQEVYQDGNKSSFREISTKVLKTEKTLKYMQTKYLPVWLARKKEELDIKNVSLKKFSYYFEKFLNLHSNDKGYRNRLFLYNKVNSYFKDFEIHKITRLMIKEYLFEMDEIQDSTKKKYLSCIKGVLDIAVDDEIISKNIAMNINFKRSPKKEIEPFCDKEVSLLLNKSQDMFKNFLGIAIYTGMRPGEILGLMHSDILEDRITVKRSVSRGNITTPKTIGSIRDIPMFESVKPFIKNQLKLSESLYLFDNNRHFISDVSFFRNKWNELIATCDIKYRTLYNTRHSFITAALNSGKFKIMDIAAIVGHNSPQMIMTHYAGFIKEFHLKVDTNIDLFSDTQSDTLNLKFKG